MSRRDELGVLIDEVCPHKEAQALLNWQDTLIADQCNAPEKEMKALEVFSKAMDKQEGGGHYKDMSIQPVKFCQINKLNYCEANVVKYICRHANKNGVEDLRKAIHYIEMLIEMEYGE